MSDGEALRAHIQDILLDYALTHLTTDYVAYTYTIANELLVPNLHLVSTADPTSFTFEPSVAKTVCAIFNNNQPAQYEERWAVDKQLATYLKEAAVLTGGKQPTETCWDEETDDKVPNRPMSPALTVRAIKDTPALGSSTKAERPSAALKALTKDHGVHSVDVEKIEDPKLDINVVLGNRLIFDDGMYNSANALLKNILSGHHATSSESNGVLSFLRADSPVHDHTGLIDIPLFPREKNGLRSDDAPGPSIISMKDIPSLLPEIPVHNSDDDIFKQHMVVINGWEALECPTGSPPFESTPSLGSSSSQMHEVDELLLLSPSVISYSRDLENARMDDIELSRSARIGESQSQTKCLLGGGQSLSTFLSSFHLPPAADLQSRPTDSGTPPSSPRTSITASMLGQFGDHIESNGTNAEQIPWPDLEEGNDDLGGILEVLFKEKLPTDPTRFISDEKLDERDSLLMDVPNLSPPTSGSIVRQMMPQDLSSLILDGQRTHVNQIIDPLAPQIFDGFLQRTKGLKSLNMELSWRPFDFGTSVPTHEEVTHTKTNLRADCVASLENECGDLTSEETISALLDLVTLTETTQSFDPSDTAWTSETNEVASPSNRAMDEFILNAAERRRIYGLPEPSCDDAADVFEDEHEQPSSPKRFKPQPILYTARSKNTPTANRVVRFEDADENEGEEPDTLDYVDPFHDSGIHIQETELATPAQFDVPSTSVFGGLASSAEGFQGPDEDGDVIPDIDPVHMNDTDGPRQPNADAKLNGTFGVSTEQYLSPTGHKLPPVPQEPRQHHPSVLQESVAATSVPTAPLVADALDGDSAMNSVSTSLSATKTVSASRSLQQFMKLRSRHASTPEDETTSDSGETQTPVNIPSTRPYKHFNVPPELLGKFTLTLPADSVAQSAFPHYYLASLDLLQKRGLVHALARQTVHLIEREFLGGVDMILDQDTAVLFVSLRTLPAQCEALISAINKASWDFLHILVVFETFSPSAYAKNDENIGPMADPFSPPVVKAVKKLRRDLSIAEGCDDKRIKTVVQLAFPLAVEDVARTLRLYGDMAYHRDETGGLLWNDRRWLDVDEEDMDEQDLAAIDGMNVFAAAVILANMGLDAFLGQTPQERIDQFGSIIGANRVNMFNRVVERRLEAMQLPPSSPPATSLENSNPVTPLEGIFEDNAKVDWISYE